MPSTISDFSKRVKKMAPDVGLATNYNGEKEYNAIRSNPFKRSVTLNNAGNPARTGWLVHIKLDTKAIYKLNQCSFTFADLRVYDSDQVTELQHWVEAPNTEWTSIFTRVNLPTSDSKTIWLYYGNPGLESKSDINTLNLAGTSPNIFNSSRLRFWGKANEPSRETGGEGFKNAWPAKYLRNMKGGPRFDLHQDSSNIYGSYPIYYYNQINGLPEFRFDGSNDFLRQGSYPNVPIIRSNKAYHIFSVMARADSGANWILVGEGSGATNQKLHFGWRDNTTFSLAQYGNDLNVIVSGYTSKNWELWEGRHHNNHHSIVLNGIQIASNSNGTGFQSDRILRVGERDDSSDNFKGGLAELLIFEPPSVGLSGGDLLNIRVYLRIKYTLYDTSLDPTIAVNAQQDSDSVEWNYVSHAPFSEFRENVKGDVAVYPEAQGTVKLTNLMQKTLAVGNSAESWSLSDVDKTGNYISSQECRTRIATSSTGSNNIDWVKIERLDGGNNRGDLGKFEIENIVEPTTYYSTNDDHIEFELWVSNAGNINELESDIRFEDVNGSIQMRGQLNHNENLLGDKSLNIIRIKKSNFTQNGLGTWSEASYWCKIKIVTVTGTEQVWYGNVKQVRRFDSALELDYNHPIRLRNCVSSDNDESYYKLTIQNGRITGQKNKDSEFEIDTEDYLKIIQHKKFSDFDSFPGRFVIFDLNDEDGQPNQNLRYFTFALTKILGFIFPSSSLDIDLDFKSGDDQVNGNLAGGLLNLQFFYILSSEGVGDKIQSILKACGGMLYFNQTTGKISARSGYKIWDKNSGLLPTAYHIQDIVKDGYKEANASDAPIYNYIEQYATMALRNRSNSVVGMQGIGTGGGLGTIPPTGSNGSATLFLGHGTMTRGDLYTVLTDNIRIAGWNFWTDDKTGFNNSGITIKDIAMIDDQIAVTFTNSNSTEKTLAAMTFRSDFLSYTAVSNWSVDGIQEYKPSFSSFVKNSESVVRRGEQRYLVDNRIAFVPMDNYATDVSEVAYLPDIYLELINSLSLISLVQAEIPFNPYLHLGKYVSIRNKEGRLVFGYIVTLENYSKNGEYRSVVTVRGT